MPPSSFLPSMEENHHHHHQKNQCHSSSSSDHHHLPSALPPPPTTISSPLLPLPAVTPSDSHAPHASSTVLNNASPNNPLPHSLSLSLLGPPSSNARSIPPSKALPFAPSLHPLPDRHSREDCWTEGATNTLIDAWGDRYLDLNRGNLKQKHWKDVADAVNAREDGHKPSKTDMQCKNRLDTLKKKYKLEKSRIVIGGGPSKWTFYEKLDELLGPSKKQKKPSPIKITLNDKQPVEEDLQKLVFHNVANPNMNTHLLDNPNNFNNNIIVNNHHHNHNNKNNNNTNTNTNNHNTTTDTISKSKDSPDMTDSCVHGLLNRADGKSLKRKRLSHNPFKDLALAVLKFGEVYERVECAKQHHLMDLERQRMEFTKDLELQRMQLFMQTQVELAKMKHGKHGNSTEHYI